jgi:disulfide bond formation protein DsbB
LSRPPESAEVAKPAEYSGRHLPVNPAKHSPVIALNSTASVAQDRTHLEDREIDVTLETTAIRPHAAAHANPALTAALVIAVIATVTLAGAWFFQLVLDIRPCPLCLEQRYAYYLAIPLAALTALAAARDAPRALLYLALLILALATLGNAGLATYHAGVEWKFWQGPTECTGPIMDFGSAGSLLERLDKVKVIRCDEVQWRFLGLSLAGYNVLISLLMAAIATWGIVRLQRRRITL